jgi:hypothetical protein
MTPRQRFAAVVAGVAVCVGASGHGAAAGTQCLVINEVYSAGGQLGASYNRNFVELLNRCPTTTSLSGVYLNTLSSDNSWQQSTSLSGALEGGHFFLVGFKDPGSGAPLPSPDASSPIMGDPGKAYLTTNPNAPLACPSGSSLIDLVGYGNSSAPCFEGLGPAPDSAATKSASRMDCSDTDDNAVDFTLGDPSPQNTSSPPVSCAPTAVLLTSLKATRSRGGVSIRWRTPAGAGLLAFDLYRTTPLGTTRLTRLPLPSVLNEAARSYSWLDRRAPRRPQTYRIEGVRTDGTRVVLGSVAVT